MTPLTRNGRQQNFHLRDENFDDPLDDIIREEDIDDLNGEDHASGEEEENLDGPIMRKTRGPTLMKHLWGTPIDFPKRKLETNQFGQPVGEKRSQFIEFLGTIARNERYCPIDVDRWPQIPRANKNDMLLIVKAGAFVAIKE